MSNVNGFSWGKFLAWGPKGVGGGEGVSGGPEGPSRWLKAIGHYTF